MKTNAYLITRLAIGATIFGHGLVRLPKLGEFAQGTAESFEKSILPAAVVLPFGYLIAVSEFIIGLLVLAGLFTRQASVAGGLLMILLIAGTSLIENWGAIPSQLLHTLFFILLIEYEEANSWAADNLIKKRQDSRP
ncbi:MAG: DoxX family protein [Cytophagaceae bacterium SCN 52-12]|nr:MAG: DoxX family protein [Cytophagaceae bacterium SCN 52-12]